MEDLLISSREVMANVNAAGLENPTPTTNMGNGIPDNVQEPLNSGGGERGSPVSSPNLSPRPSPKVRNKREHPKTSCDSSTKEASSMIKLDDNQVCNSI